MRSSVEFLMLVKNDLFVWPHGDDKEWNLSWPLTKRHDVKSYCVGILTNVTLKVFCIGKIPNWRTKLWIPNQLSHWFLSAWPHFQYSWVSSEYSQLIIYSSMPARNFKQLIASHHISFALHINHKTQTVVTLSSVVGSRTKSKIIENATRFSRGHWQDPKLEVFVNNTQLIWWLPFSLIPHSVTTFLGEFGTLNIKNYFSFSHSPSSRKQIWKQSHKRRERKRGHQHQIYLWYTCVIYLCHIFVSYICVITYRGRRLDGRGGRYTCVCLDWFLDSDTIKWLDYPHKTTRWNNPWQGDGRDSMWPVTAFDITLWTIRFVMRLIGW